MRLTLAAPVLLTLWGGLVTGCSAPASAPASSSLPQAPSHITAHGEMISAEELVTRARFEEARVQADNRKAPEIAFTGSSTLTTPISTPRRPASGRTAVVGIYGDLITTSPTANAPGDGANNLSQVSHATEGADFDPDIDPQGKWVVFASTQHRHTSDIYLKAVDGNTLTQLTNDPADDVMPEFSPDGQRVAFASDRSGNWDIFVMPVGGGQAVQVTFDPDHELHPSWAPDGKTLVYCKFGAQSQRWEMWVVDSSNPSVRHFIDYGLFPQWNPDPAKNKILFQRSRQRGSRYHSVWTIDYVDGQGKSPTEIISAANAATINPAWAPDGEYIVFVTVYEPDAGRTDRPRQSDLWIVRLDGTGRTNLTQGDFANFQPTWGADGNIYFVSDRGGIDNLWSSPAPWNVPPANGNGAFATVPTSQ
jgi:TolB protein